MSNPHLDFQARHQIGNLLVDCNFALSAHWTILFGPSGSGKSTILKIIAGLIKPASGRILLQQQTVVDTSQAVNLPTTQRAARWAGQQAALFPHMTVQQNLSFGQDRLSKADDALLSQAVDHFQLEKLKAKYPYELSGGEQQRISVVRAALSAQGKTLLLDEPFSGLDFRIRDSFIEALKAWLPDTPIVSVTHSVEEAFLLNAWIVKIDRGTQVAEGYPDNILAKERESIHRNLARTS